MRLYKFCSTVISPGAAESELPASITEPDVAAGVDDLYENFAISAGSFARMVMFAMSQLGKADITEILFRPTAQAL